MKKKFFCFLLVVIMSFGGGMPSYAWKLSTHNYSANLILEELQRNNGKLEVYPFGKYKIPEEFYKALKKYPDSFRAGALGPDVYPEMITGQSNIHPMVNGVTSGQWFDLLVEEYQKMPSSSNKEKALAFILGYAVHYSGDLFGHTYVNEWTGGAFPDLVDAATSETKTKNIERHIILESYIDSKVPDSYKKGENIKINAPKDFVKEALIVKGHRKYKVAFFLEPILDLRDKLKEKADELKAFSGTLSPDNLLKYGVNTNIAGYSERWYKDIDKGIYEYIKANEKMAIAMLDMDKGIGDTIKPIADWMSDYAPQMSPVPDAAVMYIGLKKDVAFEIANAVGLDEIEKKWNEIKSQAFMFAFSEVFGIDIEELVSYIKDPATYIDSDIFQSGNQTSSIVNKDLGNFNEIDNLENVDFDPFYNTCQMSKLVLLGADNLNSIFKKTKFKKTPMYGAFDKLNIRIRTKSNSAAFWSDSGSNGTDDDIFFYLNLKNGRSYRLLMDKPGVNDFEGGNNRVYEMELPEFVTYGEVQSVKVEKKVITNDDWGPDYIEVYPDSGKMLLSKTYFNKYFKGNTSKTFPVNTSDDFTGYSQLDPSIINFINTLDGDHQWAYAKFYSRDKNIFNDIFRNIDVVDAIDKSLDPYYDDLNSTKIKGFDIYGGIWQGTGAGINGKSSGKQGGKLVLKDKNYDNFIAETEVGVGDYYKRNKAPYQDSGLIFRVTRPNVGKEELNGYYFAINSIKNQIRIGAFYDHDYHPIKDIDYKINSYNDVGEDKMSYTLKVKAVEDEFDFYVDGNKVYSMKDDRFSSGSIGFRQYANVDDMFCFFDRIDIKPLDSQGKVSNKDTNYVESDDTSYSNYNDRRVFYQISNSHNYNIEKANFAVSFDYKGEKYYTSHRMNSINKGIYAKLNMNDTGKDNGSTIIGNYFDIIEKDESIPHFTVENYIGDEISDIGIAFYFTIDGKNYVQFMKLDDFTNNHMFDLEMNNNGTYFEKNDITRGDYLVPTY